MKVLLLSFALFLAGCGAVTSLSDPYQKPVAPGLMPSTPSLPTAPDEIAVPILFNVDADSNIQARQNPVLLEGTCIEGQVLISQLNDSDILAQPLILECDGYRFAVAIHFPDSNKYSFSIKQIVGERSSVDRYFHVIMTLPSPSEPAVEPITEPVPVSETTTPSDESENEVETDGLVPDSNHEEPLAPLPAEPDETQEDVESDGIDNQSEVTADDETKKGKKEKNRKKNRKDKKEKDRDRENNGRRSHGHNNKK